ncbi:MAG TPA: hypothetical protein VGA61_14730, partial [Anaerolineae bacterium]
MNQKLNPPKLPAIRNRYFLVADLILIPLAVGISFLLRLDAARFQTYIPTMLVFALAAEAVKPPVFYFFGLY